MRLVMRFVARVACAALTLALLPRVGAPQSGLSDADRRLARDIFRELIEINTTDSLGNTPRAARAMARRLVAAGFPAADVQVLIGPDPRHGNLVARYRAPGPAGRRMPLRPVLVFAHLDVVPARRADWSVDPFTFLEQDGYFYGRGTTDDKVGDAILVADFIRLKRAGFRPTRDLILVLTGDEETAGSCIAWLVAKHRDLIDAEFALNTDAGGGVLKDPPDSAGLARLSALPFYNSKLRTTCVATMLTAGHAENALPQAARATVNCRILPGEPASDVEATLRRLAADDRISVSTVYVPIPSPPSPLTPAIMGPLERLVADQFPGVPIVPVMEAGATDGLFLRNAGIATYGVSAVFEDPSDIRAHGRDERIGVQSFYDALEFWHRMLRAFAS